MATTKGNTDLTLIKELAKVLEGSELTEIEMKKGDLKIRVSKNGGPTTQHIMAGTPMAAPAAAPAASAAPAAATPMPTAAPKQDHPDAVTSPMVGTCYLRPSPDADLFAEIGSKVKEGDTIMLVEAMKTFNSITAPKSGTLSAVFIEDVSPVEFGDSLFLID
jgi:acetyl-CoA carboxylase biotin carboxyl carrier protein